MTSNERNAIRRLIDARVRTLQPAPTGPIKESSSWILDTTARVWNNKRNRPGIDGVGA